MGTMPAFILECKDYPGSIGYGDDDGVLHGRLKFIRDLVIHEGDDAKHLKAAFQEAVDGYPAHREADDRKPDMPRKRAVSTCAPAGSCTAARCAAQGAWGQPHTVVSDALRRELELGGMRL